MKFDENYKLCYIDRNVAFFTKLPLSEQWGDDWDDAPYDCNAGHPYDDDVENQIKKLMYYCENLQTPAQLSFNCPYSVKSINNGATAWLWDRYGSKEISIKAGCTMQEFCDLVKKAEGEVFVNLNEVENV